MQQQHQVEQHLEEVDPTEGNYPDDRKMQVCAIPVSSSFRRQ